MSINSKNRIPNIGIFVWISVLTTMILLLIIVGGLTRLTDSGLSIVNWRPIMGILPPLTNQAWIEIFENYKLTPEYQIVNFSISLIVRCKYACITVPTF